MLFCHETLTGQRRQIPKWHIVVTGAPDHTAAAISLKLCSSCFRPGPRRDALHVGREAFYVLFLKMASLFPRRATPPRAPTTAELRHVF